MKLIPKMSLRTLYKALDMGIWKLRYRIFVVAIYSILSVFLYKSFIAIAPVACAIAIVNIRRYRKVLLIAFYIFMLSVISQGFFYYGYYEGQSVHIILWILRPSTPLLGTITGGIALTLEGIIHGVIVGTKIVTLMLLGVAFASKTKVSEFVPFLKKYSHDLALSVAIVLRYIPIIADDFENAYNGLLTRGTLKIGKFKTLKLLFKAVIVNLSKRAESIAISMYFRGHAR
ncbi:MAG: hypothetical protein DRN26_01515 [Thermoplasmata archaeon]|nr:MAG: hypothetical protein DRN26_01515 [Thermoplasmata archaeon]